MANKESDDKDDNPILKDVETGSDADETPVAEPEKVPPEPNTED